MDKKPYYLAYEDRYRQVHEKGLLWLGNKPTPEVSRFLNRYNCSKNQSILEVGCGEGRDSLFLLSEGFNVLGTDSSLEAIETCNRLSDNKYINNFMCLDFIESNLNKTFDFIYSVAVLHMLVEDVHRDMFFKFIKKHLDENGKALIMVIGDGEQEMKTDTTKAFELVKRCHEETDTEINIASTSCRVVKWEHLFNEVKRNGFKLLSNELILDSPGFSSCMSIVISI